MKLRAGTSRTSLYVLRFKGKLQKLTEQESMENDLYQNLFQSNSVHLTSCGKHWQLVCLIVKYNFFCINQVTRCPVEKCRDFFKQNIN